MSAPTPLELTIDALANAYGLTAEAVLDLAIRNLAALAAYQLGQEGAPAERVFALLLAPPIVKVGGTRPIIGASSGAPQEAPTWPEHHRAAPGSRDVLEAASAMTEPFTSRQLRARMAGAVSASTIGMSLAKAGWPAEPPKPGYERMWLPRLSRE